MESLTLKQQWDLYTKNIKSPQIFLDWGFYFLIGAALQRRVWLGPYLKPIFPNLYVILCAEPGIGKSLVLDDVSNLLKHHKLHESKIEEENKLQRMIEEANKDGASSETILMLRQASEAMAQIKELEEQKKRKPGSEEPLLFPVGADSTSYESLVQQHARAVCKIKVNPCSIAPSGLYIHNSICFVINELSSLFNKNAEKIVRYLLDAYDCKDYLYETKHFGVDRIRKGSLNIIGGTTPDFMEEAFSNRLLNEGYSSRNIFVYANSNRFHQFIIPDYEPEQLLAREKILIRLKQLSRLFGNARHSEDAYKYLSYFFTSIHPYKRANLDPRLKHYYSRKELHLQKLAMCMHYADSDSMIIDQYHFENAAQLTEETEDKMHLCLSYTGRNPLGLLQRKIFKFIQEEQELGSNNGKSFIEIYLRFIDDGTELEVEECLRFLIFSNKLDNISGLYIIKEKQKE